MLRESSKWKQGEKAELSRRSGVSKQHINNIFNEGRAVSRDFCRILVLVAKDMGKDISYLDLIDSDTTTNPLFRNKFALENKERLEK